MAFYVSVPRDLSRVKTKVLFNLTKRQLICFALAGGIGFPVYFLVKEQAGTSLGSLAMIVSMMPLFLMAMYEKNGQPMEVLLAQYVQSRFVRPKVRPYRTENLYAALEEEAGRRGTENNVFWKKEGKNRNTGKKG